jgi:uncharacterized protein
MSHSGIMMRKWIYFVLGTICLVLAYIGIVLPGIPGTPFILLTAFFYVRSSDRVYAWLLRQKIFRTIIQKFENKSHISLKLKIAILIPFLISIVVAELFLVKTMFWALAVGVIAVVHVVIKLIYQPSKKENQASTKS